jgi:hypothetical protein
MKPKKGEEAQIKKRTAPISSFRTPILLSFAAETPFWIRIDLLERKLFKGHPASRNTNPANAERPRRLQ